VKRPEVPDKLGDAKGGDVTIVQFPTFWVANAMIIDVDFEVHFFIIGDTYAMHGPRLAALGRGRQDGDVARERTWSARDVRRDLLFGPHHRARPRSNARQGGFQRGPPVSLIFDLHVFLLFGNVIQVNVASRNIIK
jgi:hypothetical protein